jgi:hypothetical protein
MKDLLLLCFVLLFGLGCASEGGPGTWDEFWKDLRGDNMLMRSDFAQAKATVEHSMSTKSSN